MLRLKNTIGDIMQTESVKKSEKIGLDLDLASKYKTRVEVIDCKKHSCFLHYIINQDLSFITQGTQ